MSAEIARILTSGPSPAVDEPSSSSHRDRLFPRLARLIQQRLPDFGGHRTLFWAAPRLAAVFALAPMCVFGLYMVRNDWRLLLATSLLASAVVAVLSFLFLTVMGVIERDNEDKARQLECAYEALKITNDAIRDDLERARVVQQRMLPDLESMPLSDRVDWAASFVPQEMVGGDYFDVAPIGHDRIAILFADVSGHGMCAALLTALMKSSFQSWLEQEWSLEGFVRLLNHRLYTLTPEQSYAATTLAVFDATTSELTYCNCGHNPEPYVIGPSGRAPQRLDEARNLILGITEGFIPRTATLELGAGDTVVFATDGVTEAPDRDDQEFGIERLESYLSRHHATPVSELVGGLRRAVSRHVGQATVHDDLAILAFRVRP